MRISDWSSDVCSSDLVLYAVKCNPHPLVLGALYKGGIRHFDTASLGEIAQVSDAFDEAHTYFMHPVKARAVIKTAYRVYGVRHFVVDHRDELDKVIAEVGAQGLTIMVRVNTPPADDTRSEEHTSELQSLMRISYAVFCLKKK